ncbi:CLUMA_CG010161, isoform A [Clunio marinus]|uniref:CLUMA_CG010161, isoform A n=1 Tax=Clunio marinus TaxID=568069 RepID=A0A1J1I862_9DIPT|nr:CLUMA_CG010161, isoform A [Clunio marinus]
MKKFRDKASANSQIQLPPYRDLQNAFHAYQTSWETERLESEKNRQIYSELIDDLDQEKGIVKLCDIFDGNITKPVIDKSTVNNINDEKEEETTEALTAKNDIKTNWWTKVSVKSNRPMILREIAIHKMAQDYRGGQVDGRIWGEDATNFGLHASIDLPILDLLEVDNEFFWKRLVREKIRDVLKHQKLLRDSQTNWKRIAIELLLAELVENLEEHEVDGPMKQKELKELVEKLNSFVENLSILSLKPRKFFNENENFQIVNFTSNDCRHASLEFLGGLSNLKSFSVSFMTKKLEFDVKYRRKLFQVAVSDIEKLGKCLKNLKMLENLTIRYCDLSESEKMNYLLTSLMSLNNLKHVDLSYSQITSKFSGECFEKFLSTARSLNSLELKGNKFDVEFGFHFAKGIESFQGMFDYLGLSLTSSFGSGLDLILKSVNLKQNVSNLDISGCDNDNYDEAEKTFRQIINLIGFEGKIVSLNINNNMIKNSTTKEYLIKSFDKNYLIQLNCNNCGFSSEDMIKIKTLNIRNIFYKENPILKKENFSVEDEMEIEKYFNETKHPLILKAKKNIQVHHDNKKDIKATGEYFNLHHSLPETPSEINLKSQNIKINS